MLNPCCCLSPRIGAFIFAILDLALAVPYTWAVINNIFNSGLHADMLGEIIFCALLLTMAVLLLLGAWKNSADKIRLWLILWIVLIIIALAFQIFNIYSHHDALGPRRTSSLGGLLLFFYQIWVVYAYLVELRNGPGGLTYCPTQITV